GWSKCFGSLPRTGTNNDGTKLRRRRRAEQRHVKSGGLGLLIERALHQCVRHDADNRSPWLRFGGIKNAHLMPERALVPPVLSSKTRVHDRHRLLRVIVIDREIAAFADFQSER